MNHEALNILEKNGLKATPNRVLVLKALLAADSPMSLIELENELQTLERSSISRVLQLLSSNKIIHIMEDGRGISKYEVCHGDHDCGVDDTHVHFYCDICQKVYCFEDIPAPHIPVPPGFDVKSVNFMLKGICPECSAD